MDSGSITLMTKALLLSVLIHLILLFILGKISFSVPPVSDFPSIRVLFKAAASAPDPAPGSENAIPEDKAAIPDSVTSEPSLVAAAVVEPVMPPPERTEPVSEAVTPDVVIPLAGPEEPSEERSIDLTHTEPLPPQSDRGAEGAEALPAAIENTPSAPGIGDPAQMSLATAPESGTSGDSGLPDVSWEGSALMPRSIPEPDFTIPYNASLPEYINVSFTVSPDGTVISCKVLPPGSGHVDLNRQIRAYVADFLFEEFDFSESRRRGTLTLSLQAMGDGL